jgi:lysophospholipase L1-like esterase
VSFLTDTPNNSWATGANPTVNSLCLRIKAINPVMNCGASNPPNAGNDAVTGAKAAGTNAQAVNAVARNPKAELVTILIGANDVCTSTEAGMTSIASFRSSIDTTLQTLSTGLPNARIQVMSIPDIFNLWQVGRVSSSATLAWGLFSVCQSMLAQPNTINAATTLRRNNVRQRNIDFNTQLAQACANYIHCKFDNNAAYNLAFVLSDLSTIDYFHPSVQGQAKAANVAWSAGYNYTDLTAPTTTINRDRVADGSDDWYKNDVTVSLTATDSNAPVAGSEFFYKLEGQVDKPWTKYTGAFTINTEGKTEITARSVDANGNVEASKSDLIKIDKTAPTFTLSCPTGPYVLGSTQNQTISAADGGLSGFAEDPNGDQPLDTTQPGFGQSNVAEVQDRAGNTTQHSCSYAVVYPDPSAPALTSGSNPNANGLFTLGWNGADPSSYGIRYQLQHRDADDAGFTDVTTGLSALSYALTNEAEGTWRYRVKGSDAADTALDTAFSPESGAIKVDKTPPAAPSAAADRAPDYAGGGGWYKDTVTVTFTDNGDPALADGSAGTGVDLSTLTASITSASTGSHTPSGTVKDQVGNESGATSLPVKVDRTAPQVLVTCPATALLHGTAFASITASDGESGLAIDPTGSPSISTATVGTKISSGTAVDNVGHMTSQTCSTAVQYAYGGIQQPVNGDGSSIFKQGSTVPVKFSLTDANGQPISGVTATLDVAKLTNAIEGTFVEAASNGAANDGNLFRPNGSGSYIFNLGTKPLSAGTWSLRITLDDGTTYRTHISLR